MCAPAAVTGRAVLAQYLPPGPHNLEIKRRRAHHVMAAKAGYLKKKGGFRKNWLWRWFAIEMNVPFLIRKWCTIRGPRPNLKEKEAPEQVAKDARAAKAARRPGWPN